MSILRLLLVDDDASFRRHFEVLAGEDFVVLGAAGYAEAVAALSGNAVDAVLLDVDLREDRSGLDLLAEIRRREPDLPVIMVSADDNSETIVAAMRAGAQDYVPKHADLRVLKLKIEKRLEDVAWRRHARDMQAREDGFVGSSRAASSLREEILRVARRSVRVLIRGESGTGKELVAEAIHRESDRRAQRLVRMNGAFGSDELFEAQMFGHERGAFTGAAEARRGRLELASGGTLFLDEVGKMSLARQAKLLRVLDGTTFERIGGSDPIRADFRLVTASNESLETLVSEGSFAEDFFYRIGEYVLRVPPLRERMDDLPELANALLRRFAEREGLELAGLGAAAMEPLFAHSWPGNVRELDSVLKRAVVLSPGGELSADAIAAAIGGPGPAAGVSAAGSYRSAKDAFDRAFLRSALDESGGDVNAAAKRVGLSRASLYRRIKALGLGN